jgi:hypothetical protein
MPNLIVYVSMLLSPLLLMCFIKLAARMLGLAIKWLDCLLFALLLAAVSTTVQFSGLAPAGHIGGVLGFLLSVGAGACYFHYRARRTDGQPLAWSGAFKLSALAFVMLIAFTVVAGGALLLLALANFPLRVA